jgi:prevent-host-death family protein
MLVNVLEAKTRLSELIRAVNAGQDVVIANRGKPVARLVPNDQDATAIKGNAQAILASLERLKSAARAPAQIEADIAELRAAWD